MLLPSTPMIQVLMPLAIKFFNTGFRKKIYKKGRDWPIIFLKKTMHIVQVTFKKMTHDLFYATIYVTRESFHRRDFGGALEYCYYDDLSNGPFNNLMPVGKLRKFEVMMKSELKEDKVRGKARVEGHHRVL